MQFVMYFWQMQHIVLYGFYIVYIQAYKVSSGLLGNLPLIKEISKTNMPIILSTGMASENDIDSFFITIVMNLSSTWRQRAIKV